MVVAELERPVAKKNDTSVRLDFETAEVLRKVAALKGVSIGEFLRAVVLPIAKRELLAEAKKITRGGDSSK
jgi:uncharacterized protein (DUF1778 family)